MATILIVEDEVAVSRTLKRALAAMPERYDVCAVTSARAGLTLMAERTIDCVVLDYLLPDIDGLACLGEIRRGHPDVPVIMITGSGSEQVAVEAMKGGAKDYVAKHRRYVERLCQVVREAIAQRELDRANARMRRTFVGRHDEVARLRAATDDASAGYGRIVLISGEPGIGKTSLADHAKRDAVERGFLALRGRCDETSTAPDYWPWREIVRAYVDAQPTSAGDELDPELAASLAALRPSAPCDSRTGRFELFDHAARFMKRAARRGSLMLLLDDLHWADEPSLDLLRFVVRALANARVLIVGSYREGELRSGLCLATLLADLRREPVYEEIHLRGLSEPEVEEQIRAIARRDVPAEFVRAIYGRTEGNPFFVEEILRHLVEERLVYHDGAAWQCTIRAEEMPIPASVREVIRRRLAHLSPDANQLLAAAAVLGPAFAIDQAVTASGLPPERAVDALDEALRARVVAEAPGSAPTYRFTHALIRETLHDELAPATRLRLQADAARVRATGSPAQGEASAATAAQEGAASDAVFRCEGEYWTLAFDGKTVRMRGTKGMQLLAYLLGNPGRAVHVLDLIGAEAPVRQPSVEELDSDGMSVHRGPQRGLETSLDAHGCREFRVRLAELPEEIAEAEANNDQGHLDCLRREKAWIERDLEEHFRFGRTHRTSDPVERARVNITKNVGNACRRIARVHRVLGLYLQQHIKTGVMCEYRPDPRHAVSWVVGPVG